MPYLVPRDVEEACAILARGSPRVIAGCTDFFPGLPAGACGDVMDITRMAGARGVEETAEGWRIGAAATWTDIVQTPLPGCFDGLKQAARQVGSRQIQNRATVVGNLCNASPAADGVPPLLALDAQVEVVSGRGVRQVPLRDFITGVRQVDLAAVEFVLAVHVPRQAGEARAAFLKLGSRTHLVISIVMAAAVVIVEQGVITRAALAVGSCSPVAQRLPGLEAQLTGQRVSELADLPIDPELHLAPLAPVSDVRGSAGYRLEAAAELCRRALLQAAGEDAQ